MSGGTPADRVSLAQKQVRQALAEWDASNLERANAGRELLEQAARELISAESALVQGASASGAEMHRTLLTLKRDLATLTRLIDACSAFHRGLLVRLGRAASSYDASGRAIQREPAAPALGVQG